MKSRNFFIPIISLVIFSIIAISTFNAYLNITTFSKHIDNDIKTLQKTYLEKHKKEVQEKVDNIFRDIEFQISKVEEFAKDRLKERLSTSMKIINFIYNQKKGKISDEQIVSLIAKHFSVLTYGNDGYFFMYNNKTNIMKFHIRKDFIGKDVYHFVDKKGQRVIALYAKKLKKEKVAYAKIYFPKPSDPTKEYPKLVIVTKFEPLNLTIGTGIYLDDIEKKVQKLILEKYNDVKMKQNSYTFFMKLHNINGGKHFATMILNPNRPDLINKKLDDDVQDASGKYYRKEYLAILQTCQSGFLKYWYKKPYMNEQKPKMSYFRLQKEWNWIIASGFYYDYLEKEIAHMKQNLTDYSTNIMQKTLIWIIILSFFVIAISIFVTSKINDTILKYTHKIENLNQKLKDKRKQVENNMKIISEHVVISKTDLHGKIIEVSDAFCKLSGYSREELIGKPHNIVRHPDMPKSAFKDMWATIKKDKTWKGEVKNLKKDGGYYWFIADISPMYDEKDKKIGYMAIRTDITAKKDYEEEHKKLIQAERLASMGELIGNIAHQWRQPLSAISTAASAIVVEKEYGILTDKKLIEFLNSIEKHTQYLSNTIENFKNFTKNEKIEKLFFISEQIDSFLKLVNPSIEEHDIKLILHIDKTLELFGYENDLTQCYINIFHNIEDVFEDRNIKEKLIFISVYKEKNNIIISFKDNAGGIEKDILPKVFEPYFTTKHQSQGTGLGLHIAYNIIVNELNGKIEVANETFVYKDKTYTGARFDMIFEVE